MIIEILLVFLVLFLLLYRFFTKNFGRWEADGIPCIPGRFPYGSFKEMVTQERHMAEYMSEAYYKFAGNDFFGWYMFGKPVLSVNSPELVKNVLVKDFDHFVDRNPHNVLQLVVGGGDIDKVWSKVLPNLEGNEWKDVRTTFSPIFTSGKMKKMVATIKGVAECLVDEMARLEKTGEDFELKQTFGKFSMDSVASCVFGVDAGSFKTGSSRLASSIERIGQNTPLDMLLIVMRLIPVTRFFMDLFRVNIFKPKESKYLNGVILQTIAQRKQTGERMNDLVDMMLDCLNDSGNAEDSQEEATSSSSASDQSWSQVEKDMGLKHYTKGKVGEDALIASAMIFMGAGYDTTSMTLAYMAHRLSRSPEVQIKLQEEIDEAFEASGGELPDYAAIQSLSYLDQTIQETLRIDTPASGALLRACTKDYTIPGTDVTLKVGDLVSIPARCIQHDQKFYPNPEEFNPDNFSPEAKNQRDPYTFMPFGLGPRTCIGMRFALLEIKIAMALVLRKFTFVDSKKNPEKIVLEPSSHLGYIKNGLWASVKRRQ